MNLCIQCLWGLEEILESSTRGAIPLTAEESLQTHEV